MKVYIAARYSRRTEMYHVRNLLLAMDIQVTSSWVYLKQGDDRHEIAKKDIEDLDQADFVLFFAEEGPTNRGGRHVEFGYALAKGKHIVVVGPQENVFHHLAGVQHVPTPLAALHILKYGHTFSPD